MVVPDVHVKTVRRWVKILEARGAPQVPRPNVVHKAPAAREHNEASRAAASIAADLHFADRKTVRAASSAKQDKIVHALTVEVERDEIDAWQHIAIEILKKDCNKAVGNEGGGKESRAQATPSSALKS